MSEAQTHDATGLKLGSFAIGTFVAADGKPFPAVVKPDGTMISVAHLYPSTHEIFDQWPKSFDVLERVASHGTALDQPFSALKVLPPIARPNLIGAGSNYRIHMAEMMTHTSSNKHLRREGETVDEFFQRNLAQVDERGRTGWPMLFSASYSSMIGAYDDLMLPPIGVEHDWEIELGVVIGASKRFVRLEDADDLIAGYVIMNDLSTVDQFRRTDTQFGTDLLVKCQPAFKPCGPFVVPKQFVDRSQMRMTLKRNGIVKQDWPVEDMVFSVDKLLTFASERMRLLPGDILFCGSPPGNGAVHGEFLVDGDVVDLHITGLGRQTNRCVQEKLERAPVYGAWPTPQRAQVRH